MNPIIFKSLLFLSFIAIIFESSEAKNPDLCNLPLETGLCRAGMRKWGFNTAANKCVSFIWGGCGGNENSFVSEEECKKTCAERQTIQITEVPYEIIPGTCTCKCPKCSDIQFFEDGRTESRMSKARGFPRFFPDFQLN